MAKIGRPSDYTEDIANELCFELAQGKSLRTVCLMDTMPSGATVFKWMREHEDFLKQYDKAKQEATDAMAEDIQFIADNPVMGEIKTIKADGSIEIKQDEMLGHRRLQIDTRKWLMAKMKPKKYGERIQHANDEDNPMPTPIFGGMSATDKPG